jgi:hypothetical protein
MKRHTEVYPAVPYKLPCCRNACRQELLIQFHDTHVSVSHETVGVRFIRAKTNQSTTAATVLELAKSSDRFRHCALRDTCALH